MDRENMISRRRIALNWSVFSTTGTGAARRAFELHRRLPRDLDYVAFVTGDFSMEWQREFPHFEFVQIGSSRSFAHRLKEGSGTFWKQLMEDHNCNLWITDTLPVPLVDESTRTSITIHDLRFLASREYVSLKRYLLMKLFMSRSLARADAVIAVSEWTSEQIRSHYSIHPSKISIIPNSVDGKLSKSPGKLCCTPEKPYLLSVGHLERRKNLETLVKAFSGVANSWDGFLVLVGGDQGSLSSILKTAREMGVSDRVLIKQSVSSSELNELYAGCEIVLCPSLYEGFGMTLLEGMAAGKPVISTGIPPHLEVAGKAALLIDPGEKMTEGFSKAILDVLNDESLAETMIADGLARLKLFSWESSAKDLHKLYLSLLEA